MTDIFVDETAWWDRVAMGLELLARKPGVSKTKVKAGPAVVALAGNTDAGRGLPSADPAAAPDLEAYIYTETKDTEILRRLNTMPDETSIDFLIQPFNIYCPETRSLVSMNDAVTTLEQHVAKLNAGEPR